MGDLWQAVECVQMSQQGHPPRPVLPASKPAGQASAPKAAPASRTSAAPSAAPKPTPTGASAGSAAMPGATLSNAPGTPVKSALPGANAGARPAPVPAKPPAPSGTLTHQHKEKLRALAHSMDPQRPDTLAGKIVTFMSQNRLSPAVPISQAVQVVVEEALRHPNGPLSTMERRLLSLRKLHTALSSYAHELTGSLPFVLDDTTTTAVTCLVVPQDLKSGERAQQQGSRSVNHSQLQALIQDTTQKITQVEALLVETDGLLKAWTARQQPARVDPNGAKRDLANLIMSAVPANLRK